MSTIGVVVVSSRCLVSMACGSTLVSMACEFTLVSMAGKRGLWIHPGKHGLWIHPGKRGLWTHPGKHALCIHPGKHALWVYTLLFSVPLPNEHGVRAHITAQTKEKIHYMLKISRKLRPVIWVIFSLRRVWILRDLCRP